MRAVRVHAFGPTQAHGVEDCASPSCGDGEVLIEVHAAGVNFPDLLLMAGEYQKLPPLPFVPGTDAAGVIRAVGAGVRKLGVGDRVLAHLDHGAYASAAVAPAGWVHRLPDSMSFVDAAAMGLVYQTAYFALMQRGAYRPGETVLITGAAGGVGLAAVQIAKSQRAVVIAGVSGPEQGEAVRAAGADHVVVLAPEGLRERLREQVLEATRGHGADIVLDMVGGEVFDAALRAVAWSGRVVVVGFASGRIPQIKANYLLVKNIAVMGLQWTDYRTRQPERVDVVQRHLFDLYGAGLLRPQIDAVLPLEQFAEALARIREGRKIGKLVLDTRAPSTLSSSSGH